VSVFWHSDSCTSLFHHLLPAATISVLGVPGFKKKKKKKLHKLEDH